MAIKTITVDGITYDIATSIIEAEAVNSTNNYPLLAAKNIQSSWTDGTTSATTNIVLDSDIAADPSKAKLNVRATSWSQNDGAASGFHIYDKTNNCTIADLQASVQGTTSVIGLSKLVLGNSIPTGTAGNSTGQLALFSDTGKWCLLTPTTTLSATKTYYVPEVDNYASLVMTAGDQTISGNKTISGNIKFSGYGNASMDSYGDVVFRNFYVRRTIRGDYTTILSTTTSVQQNSIFSGTPTAAGLENQIAFVLV